MTDIGAALVNIRCAACRHVMFFDPEQSKKLLGQVYSEAGIREVAISGLCETCFDRITTPPDDVSFDELLDGVSPDYDEERDRSHEILEQRLNDELDDRERGR